MPDPPSQPPQEKELSGAGELLPEPSEPAMLFCPVCDHRLQQSRCKLVCGTCGYFMSCADYY